MAVVLGFLVAWAGMDLRIVFDHATIIYKEETLHHGMPPLVDAKVFADEAAPIIDGKTWTIGSIEVVTNLLKYRLAEHPYAPAESAAAADALWITQDPAGGEVLLQHDKYYLVKREKP